MGESDRGNLLARVNIDIVRTVNGERGRREGGGWGGGSRHDAVRRYWK